MSNAKNDTTQSTKGATQWNRGKKKSVPPGPAIPDYARNMSVGQLVTHLSRVWEEPRARVKSLASAQSGKLPTQEEPHEAHPHSNISTRITNFSSSGEDSLINDHNANVQNTGEVRGSKFSGQSSQKKVAHRAEDFEMSAHGGIVLCIGNRNNPCAFFWDIVC
ncbi:bifunctional demethylmenaquinone methyltransferase/2-methoxy-6-polyprenyl-1,4-benzoquinol [Sesbania bispinosa]|nr:bifunctional demethylmenaquinone methyltransferase/2-methoxy-6-polyprenyl-1,4-benzoquinol [Sesbania bispinosa]